MPRLSSISSKTLAGIGLLRAPLLLPMILNVSANETTNWGGSNYLKIGKNAEVLIDWGDGAIESVITSSESFGELIFHSYVLDGSYTVTIEGFLPQFGGDSAVGIGTGFGQNFITEVVQWNNTTTDFGWAFEDEGLLTQVPGTLPPGTTNTQGMFRGCTSLVGLNIGQWNVGAVTDMYQMFYASVFNQPIGSWDVSNVTNMYGMFASSSFNQPIGSWDVSAVTIMAEMFLGASSFNQPLGGWDVSNVTAMNSMFDGASALVTNLTGWSVPSISTAPAGFATNAPGVVSPIWGATQTPLITTWTNTNNAYVFIYSENDLRADALIDWGDGTKEVLVGGEFNNLIFHNFPSTGTYTVTIRGYLPNYQGSVVGGGGFVPPPSSAGMTAVTEWNSTTVSLKGAFEYQTALTSVPNYLPPLVTDTSYMFTEATGINDPNIAFWDVSNVPSMFGMFNNAISFNQDLSNWCVSNIPSEPSAFTQGATSWTQPKPVWGTCPSVWLDGRDWQGGGSTTWSNGSFGPGNVLKIITPSDNAMAALLRTVSSGDEFDIEAFVTTVEFYTLTLTSTFTETNIGDGLLQFVATVEETSSGWAQLINFITYRSVA